MASRCRSCSIDGMVRNDAATLAPSVGSGYHHVFDRMRPSAENTPPVVDVCPGTAGRAVLARSTSSCRSSRPTRSSRGSIRRSPRRCSARRHGRFRSRWSSPVRRPRLRACARIGARLRRVSRDWCGRDRPPPGPVLSGTRDGCAICSRSSAASMPASPDRRSSCCPTRVSCGCHSCGC